MNKIKITKLDDKYYAADPTWVPGSPVCGHGRTPLHALMNLFAWSEDFDFEIEDSTGESFFEAKYFEKDGVYGVLYHCEKCDGEPVIKTLDKEDGYWIECSDCYNETEKCWNTDNRSDGLRKAAKKWNGDGYVEKFRD